METLIEEFFKTFSKNPVLHIYNSELNVHVMMLTFNREN